MTNLRQSGGLELTSVARTLRSTGGNMADAGADVTTCNCVTLGPSCTTAFANMSYSWSPASGLSNPSILNPVACPSVTTTYTLTATHTDPANGNTCTATDMVTVTQLGPPPSVSISGTTTLCTGATTTLTASGGVTYTWSTGQTTTSIVVSPTAATQYTVIASNANGCTNSATVWLTKDCPDFIYDDCRIFLDRSVFSMYAAPAMTNFGISITEYNSSSPTPCTGTATGNAIAYTTNPVTAAAFPFDAVTPISPTSGYHLNIPPGHSALDLTTNYGYNSSTASWLGSLGVGKHYLIDLYGSFTGPSGTYSLIGSDCIVPVSNCAEVTRSADNPEISIQRKEEINDQFSIFPNPAQSKIILSNLRSSTNPWFFELYDGLGHLCIKREVNKESTIEIDISNFMVGIYYIRFTNWDGKVSSRKFVIIN